jgi:DNA-directed RNA polymerase specialized sigma24 family protein
MDSRTAEDALRREDLAGIRSLLERRCGNAATAEDLLSDALETSLRKLRNGEIARPEQLAGYVQTIHVNDNLGRTDDHRLPFAGAIEWPAVLMELEKTGYSGPLVLELAGEPDAATAIARAVGARTRLQGILEDLAQPFTFAE